MTIPLEEPAFNCTLPAATKVSDVPEMSVLPLPALCTVIPPAVTTSTAPEEEIPVIVNVPVLLLLT